MPHRVSNVPLLAQNPPNETLAILRLATDVPFSACSRLETLRNGTFETSRIGLGHMTVVLANISCSCLNPNGVVGDSENAVPVAQAARGARRAAGRGESGCRYYGHDATLRHRRDRRLWGTWCGLECVLPARAAQSDPLHSQETTPKIIL